MRNWEEYKGIIFGLAFKFSPTSNQDVDDLIGEGFVCFMEVIEQEKEDGLDCPFEAALSTRIRQHFLCKDKERKQKKRTGQLVALSDVAEHPKLSENPWEAIDNYISLTEEMKEVVDIMLNAPSEFLDLLKREKFKVGLSKYLKKYKGWTSKDVKEFWGKVE